MEIIKIRTVDAGGNEITKSFPDNSGYLLGWMKATEMDVEEAATFLMAITGADENDYDMGFSDGQSFADYCAGAEADRDDEDDAYMNYNRA